MRKGVETQRFPHSALLFRFCLRVLEMRKQGEKVHDQAIGNVLQYNPSDTSHWKRGKKAVRSVYALDALSNSLDVDIETIQDLSDGALELEEAWFDYAEAEEVRRIKRDLTPELALERRRRQTILENLANELLAKANIASVPVYLPEVLSVLPFIQVSQGDVAEKLVRTSRIKPGQYAIRYRKGEMRAHTRAAITREIARVILYSEREQFGLPARQDPLTFFEVLDLSNALLVPSAPLKEETQKISSRLNLIKMLSEIFWVPKSCIRSRLTTQILENAPRSTFEAERFPVHISGARKPMVTRDLSEDDSSPSSVTTDRVAEDLQATSHTDVGMGS